MNDQGLQWRFRRSARVSERSVDELIGLCRGILADGRIVQAEADFLLSWMKANQANCMEWPMNMLFGRLSAMLEDAVLDPSEETELVDLLTRFTGGELPSNEIVESGLVASFATTLPLNSPAPPIVFHERSFCFTGEMCFGPRRACEELVLGLGGVITGSINRKLNYLVVGRIGSLAWVHSTHGRKIESAVGLREQGYNVAIISEKHWVQEADTALGNHG